MELMRATVGIEEGGGKKKRRGRRPKRKNNGRPSQATYKSGLEEDSPDKGSFRQME